MSFYALLKDTRDRAFKAHANAAFLSTIATAVEKALIRLDADLPGMRYSLTELAKDVTLERLCISFVINIPALFETTDTIHIALPKSYGLGPDVDRDWTVELSTARPDTLFADTLTNTDDILPLLFAHADAPTAAENHDLLLRYITEHVPQWTALLTRLQEEFDHATLRPRIGRNEAGRPSLFVDVVYVM